MLKLPRTSAQAPYTPLYVWDKQESGIAQVCLDHEANPGTGEVGCCPPPLVFELQLLSPTQKLINWEGTDMPGERSVLTLLLVVTWSTLQQCGWTGTSGSGYIKHTHHGTIILPAVAEAVKVKKESEERSIEYLLLYKLTPCTTSG